MIKRITCALLCIILFCSIVFCAPVYSAPSDQELINQYHIPNTWARPALLFAVRNGILQGKGNGDLAPLANASRAETATILTNILQTGIMADLNCFTDISSSAWYYSTISKAVSLGVLSGTGDGKMQPNAAVTREQACSMLARAFGVYGGNALDLSSFSDKNKVSSWAVGSVASMVHAGYLSGSDGKLNPQAKITRQELAQLLYTMITGLGKSLPTESQKRFVLSADTIPSGAEIDGDLILCSDANELVLNDVAVSGRLVIQGGCDAQTISLHNCNIHCLCTCRDAVIESDSRINQIECGATAVIVCEADTVSLYANTLTIADQAKIGRLYLCTDAAQAEVNGTVTLAVAEKNGATVCGNGTVSAIDYLGGHNAHFVESTYSTDNNSAGDCAVLSVDISNTPTVSDPIAKLSVSVSSDADALAACRLYLLVNGHCTEKLGLDSCSGNSSTTFSYNCSGEIKRNTITATVSVIFCTENERYQANTVIDTADQIRTEAAKVRTSRVPATITRQTTLYFDYDDENDILAIPLQTLSAGTKVYFSRHYLNAISIMLENGRKGWVSPKDVKITGELAYTTADYLTPVKEYFVNYTMEYSSDSKYLIWVNVWTQQINIFEGSKGNWRLIRTADCATGATETPSPISIRTIKKKTLRSSENNSYYYHHLSWTGGDIILHSRLYKNSGGFYDATIGKPASNGCIRLYDADCIWIYDNIPLGTTVVIY